LLCVINAGTAPKFDSSKSSNQTDYELNKIINKEQ
jgi:hypothetical protein